MMALRVIARRTPFAPATASTAVATSLRAFSQSRLVCNKKDKSVLDDDMLAKAGVDVNEPAIEEETETPENGQKRRRNVQSSTDKKRERAANLFYVGFFATGLGGAAYLARNWDDDEDEKLREGVPNGYAAELLWKRLRLRFNSIFTYFQEPPFPDLLPDSPPEPYKRPLTLVLTLEDLLIHSEWSQRGGWKTAKRPGVDYFLAYLSQYYEIVLFSSNYMMYSEKIVEKLDPLRAYISYQLYKEHCLYKDGAHVKDLSKLNRDLSKVVIVDVSDDAIKLQPENAVKLPPWTGTADDELVKLIPFFEYLATQQIKDVRPVLASYKDKTHIPEEFARRVEILRTEFEKTQQKKSFGSFNGLLGLPTIKQKFPLDAIHDEGVKNYQHFLKLIKEEEAKLKAQAEMPKETYKLKDLVEGNIPSQEEMMKRQIEKQAEFERQQAAAAKA